MVSVCNLRYEKTKYPYDVRVDRFNKTLGNKFYMRSELERDLVCDKYDAWFKEQVQNNNAEVLNALNQLSEIYEQYGKLRLFCWCAPKRCHAETIKTYLENTLKHKENEYGTHK